MTFANGWMLFILPVAVVGTFIYIKSGPLEGARTRNLLAFLGGVLVVYPAVVVESLLLKFVFPEIPAMTGYHPLLRSLVEGFFIAGVVEESWKFFVFYLLLRRSPTFETRYEGMLYGVSIGLGFGFVENLIQLPGLTALKDFPMPIQRLVYQEAMLYSAHLSLGAWMGYFFFRASQSRRPGEEQSYLLYAIGIPFLFHGFYNILQGFPWAYGEVAGLLFLVLLGIGALGLGLLQPLPSAPTESYEGILDDPDPIFRLSHSSFSPETQKKLCQDLLIKSGIQDYYLLDSLAGDDGKLVFKAILWDEFRVETVKFISPIQLKSGGMAKFRELYRLLKEEPVQGCIPYSRLYTTNQFILLGRPYATLTLRDYAWYSLTEAEQRDILLRVAQCLHNLWQKGWIHGRVTPENIGVHLGELVLVDAGLEQVLPPSSRHQRFLAEEEIIPAYRRDVHSLTRVADWLSGGKISVQPEEIQKEEPRMSPEEVMTSLIRIQPPGEEISQVLLQKVERLERGRSFTHYPVLSEFLRRAAVTSSNFPLLQKVDELAMSVYTRAHESLKMHQFSYAIEQFARFMEIVPEKAEMAAGSLEALADSYIRSGDVALLRHNRPELAETYYRFALSIQPNHSIALKKLESLHRVHTYSPFSFVRFLILAIFLLTGVYSFTRYFWTHYDVGTMEGGNPQRTGGLRYAFTEPPALVFQWKHSFESSLFLNLALTHQSVLAFTQEGKLISLDWSSGELQWEKKIEESGLVTPTSSPLVCREHLLVGGVDSLSPETPPAVYVFHAFTGNLQKKISFPSPVTSILCYRNLVMFQSADALATYRLSDFSSLWSYGNGGRPTSAPVVYRGLVLFAVEEGGMENLSPLPAPRASPSPEPAEETGVKFESSEAQVKESEPSENDEKKPEVSEEKSKSKEPAPEESIPSERTFSSPIEGFLTHYVFVALSVDRGEVLWKIDLPVKATLLPSLQGNILVTGTENQLLGLDVVNKKVLWRVNTPKRIGYPLIGVDGIYYRTVEQVFGISLKTGSGIYESGKIYPATMPLYSPTYFLLGVSPPEYLIATFYHHSIQVYDIQKKRVISAFELPSTLETGVIGPLMNERDRVVFAFHRHEKSIASEIYALRMVKNSLKPGGL